MADNATPPTPHGTPPRDPEAARHGAWPQGATALPVEVVPLTSLRPHPRNYRGHPDDQLQHIMQSIQEHGIYRPVVIARDGTILAGHGVVLGLQKLGRAEAPVMRLPYAPDDPRALKVLAGDNEISKLGEQDDRALTALLKDVLEIDLGGLLGTGYDELMLANLVFVSRPAHEIQDHDDAAQWVGLPEYEPGDKTLKLVLSFRSEEDRQRLMEQVGITDLSGRNGPTWAAWWPPKEREDRTALRFVAGAELPPVDWTDADLDAISAEQEEPHDG